MIEFIVIIDVVKVGEIVVVIVDCWFVFIFVVASFA